MNQSNFHRCLTCWSVPTPSHLLDDAAPMKTSQSLAASSDRCQRRHMSWRCPHEISLTILNLNHYTSSENITASFSLGLVWNDAGLLLTMQSYVSWPNQVEVWTINKEWTKTTYILEETNISNRGKKELIFNHTSGVDMLVPTRVCFEFVWYNLTGKMIHRDQCT